MRDVYQRINSLPVLNRWCHRGDRVFFGFCAVKFTRMFGTPRRYAGVSVLCFVKQPCKFLEDTLLHVEIGLYN